MAAVVFVLLASVGCERHVRLKTQMTWECPLPQPAGMERDTVAGGQLARFRYADDPHYFEETTGKYLCDQLKAAGKPVVTIEWDAWGRGGLRGYRELSIDGRPLINAGGWGGSGANDPSGSSPLAKAFARAIR